MRGQRLLTLSVVLGLVVWGCEEKKTATEPTGPAEQTETSETTKIGKESVMDITLQWLVMPVSSSATKIQSYILTHGN